MPRPFVDRPVTDLAAADRVARHAAEHWGLGRPSLLRIGMNAIYRSGDVVLRVSAPSAPAEASIELAAALRSLDLAVPAPRRNDVVRADGLSVTAWEFLESTGNPIDWSAVGRHIRRVHDINIEDLPGAYPLPSPTDLPWWDFASLLDEVGDLLDPAARAGIDAAIARWPDWADPAGSVVCHGDVHPGNIVMTRAGPVVIDWDLLCFAPPGWDHAPMMTWHSRWGGDASWYVSFAAGYGASKVGDGAAEAFAELRLVAATLMRLKAGQRSDAAMPEARRRLAYWRGEPGAPMWQAQ